MANAPYIALVQREVVGKKIRDIISKEEAGPYFENLDGGYRTGVPFTAKEIYFPFKDRTGVVRGRYLDFFYHLLKDAKGATQGIQVVVVDLTQQIEAKKLLAEMFSQLAVERHKLEALFKESPAAMALWHGPNLMFEKVNPEYQAIYGKRELVGKTLLEALPELKDQPFPDLLLKVLETGEAFTGREVMARIAQTTGGLLEDRYYDFSYLRVNDAEGKPYGVYDHAVDVTDRVLNRITLQTAVQGLENKRKFHHHC